MSKISTFGIVILAVISVGCLADQSCPFYKFEKPKHGRHEEKDEGETITCLKTVTDESGNDTILITGCPRGMECNTRKGECVVSTYKEEMEEAFFQKTKNPGSFCEVKGDCRSKLCVNFRCQGKGENETCRRDRDCETAFYCESRVCVPLKKPGEACADDSECRHEALCNSDKTCAAYLSLDVGAPAKDYLLCKSATLEGGVCAGAIRTKPAKDENICMYENTETKEEFEDTKISPECVYSQKGETACEVALGDRLMKRIIHQASNFVKMVARHGTNCHKEDGLLCVHGANEGFEENPLAEKDEEEGEEKKHKKEKHHRNKKDEKIWRDAISLDLLHDVEDLKTRLTKITGKERDEFIAWTYDPILQFVVKEHEGFPWGKAIVGTTLIGAGAAAYYYFVYQGASPVSPP